MTEKYEIVTTIDANPKVNRSDLAKTFGISAPTVTRIYKEQRNTVLSWFTSGDLSNSTKKIRKANFEDVDQELLLWFKKADSANMDGLSGEVVLEKAQSIALSLGYGDNGPDRSWINRWKSRHDIVCKRRVGEAADVNPEMTNTWLQESLPALMKQFDPCNIYNFDEFALFWKLTPDQTLTFRDKKCVGGKRSKNRITILVGSSMTGEKWPLLMIGKFKKPRCFGKLTLYPIEYKANRRAWMTAEIFEDFIRQIDRKMKIQARKICIVIDNCPAHPMIKGLTNVTLVRLPKNTTSKTQPMDGGVIRMVKSGYRRRLVKRKLVAFETDSAFEVNLLDCMHMLKAAWDNVCSEKIQNCFKHCDFCQAGEEPQLMDETTESEEDLSLWKRLMSKGIVPDDSDVSDYMEIEDDTVTSEPIFAQSAPDVESNSDDDDDTVVAPEPQSATECIKMVNELRRFIQSQSNCDDALKHLQRIDDFCVKIILHGKKQTVIDDYFRKQ